MEQSVPSRFERIVRRYPDGLALKSEHRSHSFRELDEVSNRIARSILDADAPSGSAVAVLIEQGFLHVAALLGILKAGGAFVALDPADAVPRNRFILQDARAPLLLSNDRNGSHAAGTVEGTPCRVINLDHLGPALPSDNPGIPVDPRDVAFIVYTSGSTGNPKGVVHSHRNLLHWAKQYTNSLHISPRDRFTLVNPPGRTLTLVNIFVPLLSGAAVCTLSVERAGLRGMAEWMVREGITVYCSVPTLFRHFASGLDRSTPFPTLRMVYLGGEPVLGRDVELFQSRFPGETLLRNGFGSSECVGIRECYITSQTPFDGPVLPAGYATEDTEVVLVDEEGREVPPGEIGEILVRSPHLAMGYHRRPDLTEDVFPPDPGSPGGRIYRTGDLGYLLPDGCLVHLGRKDFQIKVRGNRIEPTEVEAALVELPGVREAAVTARNDGMGDARLVAYLVPEAGANLITATLRLQLQQRLPPFMIPSIFLLLDALPTNSGGKLDRLRLPDPGTLRPIDPDPQPTGEDELVGQVAQLWRRLLDRPQVGPNDSFFDLGGDSLLAITMALELEKQSGVRIPIDTLFELPTPARLAEALRTRGDANLGDCLVPIQPAGSLPPFYCLHGLGGDIAGYRLLASHLGASQPVYGIRPRGMTGQCPPSFSVEEMASHYVEEILAFQPAGPYYLGGYSAGGIFAFEVARRLLARGCEVGLLAHFDSYCPGYARLLPTAVRTRRHLAVMSGLPPREKLCYVRDRLDTVRDRGRTRIWRLLHGAVRRGLPVGRALQSPERSALVAYRSYRPGPYPGRTVVFVAAQDDWSFHYDRSPTEGWRAAVSGELQFRLIPGDHGGIMREPAVAVLARELAEWLRVARETAGTSAPPSTED